MFKYPVINGSNGRIEVVEFAKELTQPYVEVVRCFATTSWTLVDAQGVVDEKLTHSHESKKDFDAWLDTWIDRPCNRAWYALPGNFNDLVQVYERTPFDFGG